MKKKMNREQKIKKYFWEQKRKELFWFFLIILGIIFIPYLLGLGMIAIFGEEAFINYNMVGETYDFSSVDEIWGIGFMGIIILFIIGLITFGIVMIIKSWIDSNWEEAENRVDLEELRK